MPRRQKPRWGDDGVQELPPGSPLSEEQLTRITEHLEANIPATVTGRKRQSRIITARKTICELATQYFVWKAQDEDGPTRGERAAALDQVQKAAAALHETLVRIDHRSEQDLLEQMDVRHRQPERDDIAQPMEELARLKLVLHWLALSARKGTTQVRRKKGSESSVTLAQIVDSLADIWERTTGAHVTHFRYKGGEYTSGPASRAGKFIAAVFHELDPKLPPSRISSALTDRTKRINEAPQK